MNADDAQRVEHFRQRLEDDNPFRHGFSLREPGRKLLDIIDRFKAELAEVSSDAMQEIKRSVFLAKQCDTLQSQLQAIKKVAEPIKDIVKNTESSIEDERLIYRVRLTGKTTVAYNQVGYVYLRMGQLRRLAAELEKVKDE